MSLVRPRALAAILGALLPMAQADPTPEEEKFMAVEGSSKFYPGTGARAFPHTALPEPVVAILSGQHWKPDGSVPEIFHGHSIDLNKDGSPEYFIKTIGGGSGGSAYIVIGQVGGEWKMLCDFQGSFHVIGKKAKAWPRLVSVSRGGGGNFCKRHFGFENGVYVETLRENYKQGEIIRKVRPGSGH
jgi:hypothetical protein